jgi:hypothetical protein
MLVPLFTSTLFVSAFLLFLVQPMVAKMVLPLLGGSPMVWNTCMVFFQIALLAGYAYAHGATKWLGGRRQVALHIVIALLPFAVLPFFVDRELQTPAGTPIFWLLLLLAGLIGLPFVVLSTSASVLQHWFSRTDHPSANDPYFLYVASNIGSFIALTAYPAFVEPSLSLQTQSRFWTAGYAVFVMLIAACAFFAWHGRHSNAALRATKAPTPGNHEDAPLTSWRRARWVALAFIPSSLMLAVTTYLSTDIAAVPLLWIVPLGLYLLTFIAAFGAKAHVLQAASGRMFPLFLVPLALLLCLRITGRIEVMFPLHVLTFVAAALVCHTRLAADRPGSSQLTEFYLWISFGGMLGGIFNGLAAPLLFNRVIEYPIVLVLACLALPVRTAVHRRELALDVAIPLLLGVSTIVAMRFASSLGSLAPQVAVATLAVFAFGFRRRPFRFAMSMGAMLAAGLTFGSAAEPVLHAERTFFGVYRVSEDRRGVYRALAHGTTLHGMQAITGKEKGEPLTYFHRGGPFGQAFASLSQLRRPETVGVIGLGVGTLAAYAEPGQRWTFYEIDEAVERIARDTRYFNFLERCGYSCQVVIGDARLSLARTPEGRYDLFVLDAFSSDSIPMHLLTSESLELYLSHLNPNGVILFHISNAHLRLAPIVGRLAEKHGLAALVNVDRRAPGWPISRHDSVWVAMARQPQDLGTIANDPRWKPIDIPAATPLWTDDFSNILSALGRY